MRSNNAVTYWNKTNPGRAALIHRINKANQTLCLGAGDISDARLWITQGVTENHDLSELVATLERAAHVVDTLANDVARA